MKIYYIGASASTSTSKHRSDALTRIGHEVTVFDPYRAVWTWLSGPIGGRLNYRTGYRMLQPTLLKIFKDQAGTIAAHDAIWVDNGELLGRECVTFLANLAPTAVLCLDDPAGRRDGRRFDSLIAALPAYDLCVTVRDATLSDFRRLGARRAMRVGFAYDEVAHRPPSAEEMADWDQGGGIAFVGTWMRGEGRDEILLSLMQRGLPISIWGGGWHRSPLWKALRPAWRGAGLFGRDYCKAITGAAACLGFLSTGNRDLHTTRSLETPYIGGLLVAKRTPEHAQLFEDGKEALFWDDVDECGEQCRAVLADPARSRAIRAAGMDRVRRGGFGNETLVASILTELGKSPSRSQPKTLLHEAVA